MITWPRVRITFALIGMFSVLYNGYEVIGHILNWIVATAEQIGSMF